MNSNARQKMVASAERRLKELGIKLPAPPEPFGTYAEAVQILDRQDDIWQEKGKALEMTPQSIVLQSEDPRLAGVALISAVNALIRIDHPRPHPLMSFVKHGGATAPALPTLWRKC